MLLEPDNHASYPHLPGTLWDCPGCESRCYCEPDTSQCVHCCIKAWMEYKPGGNDGIA